MQNIAGQSSVGKNIILPWQGQRVTPQTLLKMTTLDGTHAASDNVGEDLDLEVRLSIEAFVHCYYRNPDRVVYRILPAPMDPQVLVSAGKSMALPVHNRFRIFPETDPQPESFLCLASAENLEEKLPDFVRVSGETGLPEVDFDTLYRIYQRATKENLIGMALVHDVSEQ